MFLTFLKSYFMRSNIRSLNWGLKFLPILWYIWMLDFHSTLLHLSILGRKLFNIREGWAELLVSIFQVNIGGGRLSVWFQTKTMGRWLHKSMLLAVMRKLIFVRARYLCSCIIADVCPFLLPHQQFCTPAVHKEVLMKHWSEGRADFHVHLTSDKIKNVT